mgnify:CR=1 FL=1
MMIHPLAFGMPDLPELLIVALIGLLLFGKRLPEVGRSVGKTIIEFKKGMREVEQEVRNSDTPPPAQQPPALAPPPETAQQPYKFDPHTGKPLTVESNSTSTT